MIALVAGEVERLAVLVAEAFLGEIPHARPLLRLVRKEVAASLSTDPPPSPGDILDTERAVVSRARVLAASFAAEPDWPYPQKIAKPIPAHKGFRS